MNRLTIAAVASLAIYPQASLAQWTPPDVAPRSEWQRFSQPPPRSWTGTLIPLAASLQSAEAAAMEQVEAIASWNLAGRFPTKDGFSRPIPNPHRVALSHGLSAQSGPQSAGVVVRASSFTAYWVTRVHVAGAHRLRLRLTQAQIPLGVSMWVYGDTEAVGPFGPELISTASDLWTPSVDGDSITLEVKLSLNAPIAVTFVLSDVLQQFALDSAGQPILSTVDESHIETCLVDGKCVTSATLDVIDLYRFAVARLSFVKGPSSFLCTGALLNDTDSSTTIPYFLTANHCFDSQNVASTLESFWNYFPSTCGGAFPALGLVPRVLGSTLLATGESGDFTLLRLPSVPAGRVYLGWNASTSALTNGASLYRLSHPKGYVQTFSRARYVASPASTATDWDNASFLYATPQVGATFGGSSGAPLILPGGIVVGQLSGVFGPNFQEPCLATAADYVVDGRLSRTYPSLAPWLNPATGPTACVPDADTLCIDDQPGDRRFKVEVPFQTANQSGTGKAVPLGSLGINRGGLFWFFSPDNPELLIKVLNACGLNGRFWVFFSAGTNVGLSVNVTDTITGNFWSRSNPNGNAVPTVQDTSALPCS